MNIQRTCLRRALETAKDGLWERMLRATQGLGLVLLASVTLACVGKTIPVDNRPAVVPTPKPASPVVGGICIDTSGSVSGENRGVVEQSIEAVAQVVENWVPLVTDRSAGTSAVPALRMPVRKVLGESSLKAEGQIVNVEIPGVPGVGRMVGFVETGAAMLIKDHDEQSASADRAAEDARAIAKEFAAKIRNGDWSSPGASEIAGCLEALSLVTGSAADRRFFLVSDLEQNVPEQRGLANFDGARIFVVHTCTNATRCLELQRAWSDVLMQAGAVDVQFGRAENVGHDIDSKLKRESIQ